MKILFLKKLLAIKFTVFICLNIISCESEKKPAAQNETETSKDNIKSVESGNNFIISYDLTGMINGTMTVYKNGNNIRQKINSEIMGMKNSTNVYIINNDVYNVTEIGDKKFGNKTNLEDYNKLKQTGETITDFKEFEKFISGKKVIGTESIIDKNCEIYDLNNGIKLSVFDKKYILKIRNNDFMAAATKLDMNPVITANEFEIPKDVDFKNTDPSKIKKETLDSITKNLQK
ncbi:MAG: hypothetical protein ABIY50_12055 [Ignavibacteria bacterium]